MGFLRVHVESSSEASAASGNLGLFLGSGKQSSRITNGRSILVRYREKQTSRAEQYVSLLRQSYSGLANSDAL